jgi:hypothetical protein
LSELQPLLGASGERDLHREDADEVDKGEEEEEEDAADECKLD